MIARVQQPAGLLGHAEAAGTERLLHFFRGRTRERDLEIVDHDGAVHCQAGHVATLHQVDQHRAETGLDHVRAEPPENAALGRGRRTNRRDHRREVGGAEHLRQRVEPAAHAGAWRVRRGEIRGVGFALARCQGIGSDARQIELFVRKLHRCALYRAAASTSHMPHATCDVRRGSDNQHRVSVAVEAIPLSYGHAIGREQALAPGEGGGEHQQR